MTASEKADTYRLSVYARSLPEADEMLRCSEYVLSLRVVGCLPDDQVYVEVEVLGGRRRTSLEVGNRGLVVRRDRLVRNYGDLNRDLSSGYG